MAPAIATIAAIFRSFQDGEHHHGRHQKNGDQEDRVRQQILDDATHRTLA